MTRILLVDDEDLFRASLAKRLRARGYDVVEVANGEDAVKIARNDPLIEVAILDYKMPEMDGLQTLREIKAFRPALQAIMLTGHGDVNSATEAGKQDAFKYLQKPCELNDLTSSIEAAREEAGYAKERHEIPQRVERGKSWKWLLGSHNSRPLFIILGGVIFLLITLMPAPKRMLELLSAPKAEPSADGRMNDPIFGYASYRQMKVGDTISSYYSDKYKQKTKDNDSKNKVVERALHPEEVAFRTKVMIAVIVIGALFWGTGAVPISVTAMLVCVAMYFFGIFKPDEITMAFAKDAVFFIFGVLALSKAVSKTGLDRRIGLILLAPAKNLPLFLLVFIPLLAMTCSFLSEHALVAFTMPLLVMTYASAVKSAGIKGDRALMVLFTLSLCYAANSGGSGSPAAGGRNAIMIGILADYGVAPSFGEWVLYGFPMVPVMAFAVGVYFLIVVRPKVQIPKLDISAIVSRGAKKIGPMNRHEYITAAVLVMVILLWVTCSESLGMAGPVLLGLVLLNVFRVLTWKDMVSIHWEVVFLYAGASAMGKGLAATGGSLYLADAFVNVLPDSMRIGAGLAIASSIFTGLLTNFMSDGATVSTVGPITVPMAGIAGVHPWMVGFATAYASSFAHMLIIGTPSNALAFAMAKDPNTGEQLVTFVDFFKHGAAILVISFLVLWFWTVLGYWSWIGFPTA